jgi:fatty acid CoA ligase FadD9
VQIKAIIASNACLNAIAPALHHCAKHLALVVSMDQVEQQHAQVLEQSFAQIDRQPPALTNFAFLNELGSAMHEQLPIVQVDSMHITSIVFTSGSSGVPKGVQFTEAKWLQQITLPMTFKHVVMYGYLPLDHVAGRSDLFTALLNGGRIAFNRTLYRTSLSSTAHHRPSGDESSTRAGTIVRDLQVIRPTALGLVPLLCHHIYQHYKLQVRQLCETHNMPKPQAAQQVRQQMRFVFGDRLSSLKVTSAPVTAKIRHFIRSVLCVEVHEGYGSTEVGSITLDGSVTQPVKLRSLPELGYLVTNQPPQGEILVRRARISSYTDPSYTDAAFRGDWFCTGDIGEMTGAHSLRVIDRKCNVIKLANGEFVALENLERLYVANCPMIQQLLLHADNHKSNLVAIVVPNTDCASCAIGSEQQWPPEQRIALERSIRHSFSSTAIAHHLRGFEIPIDLWIDWSIGEWTSAANLLTNSNKLCRRNLRIHYARQIDLLYTRQSIYATLNIDSSFERPEARSFAELGGDSLTAMQVLQKLKRQSVSVTFEELMSDSAIDTLLSRSKVESAAADTERSALVDVAYEMRKLSHLVEAFSWYKPDTAVPFVDKPPHQVEHIFITVCSIQPNNLSLCRCLCR